jgi:hydrogenase small subunit
MASLESPVEIPVIWLQGGACSGCSVSVLNLVSPSVKNVLIDELLPGKHISLRYHPTVMAGSGELALDILDSTGRDHPGNYVLVVEGAISTKDDGVYCVLGEDGGREQPLVERVESLARDALAAVALGTCATFGGIPAAPPNPSGCISLQALFDIRGIDTPLINVPGCPPHPDWFAGTLVQLMLRGLPSSEDLDVHRRPLLFFGGLVHEQCPRRADFDEGKFAKRLGDPGCLYELGCKGPITHADCSIRLWNHGTSWCIGAGSPCHGCVEPGFPDLGAPLYEKIDELALPAFGVAAGTGE